MEVGISKMYNFSKTNFMFVKLAGTNSKTERVFNTATALNALADYLYSVETKSLKIPLSIGVEGQPKDWMKVRASAKMNLHSSDEEIGEGKVRGTGSTSLGSGATLMLGKLNIDGYIGANTSGTLELDDLMTRVSMTYSF
jgi:hypothetical protein